jgi:hypothetical protein
MLCSPVILHFDRKYIEVNICNLISEILGELEFSMDMFNALVRRIKQSDDKAEALNQSKRK